METEPSLRFEAFKESTFVIVSPQNFHPSKYKSAIVAGPTSAIIAVVVFSDLAYVYVCELWIFKFKVGQSGEVKICYPAVAVPAYRIFVATVRTNTHEKHPSFKLS
jgi:hypothetical protein